MDMNLGKLQEVVRGMEAWHSSMESQRVGHDLATEQQQQQQIYIYIYVYVYTYTHTHILLKKEDATQNEQWENKKSFLKLKGSKKNQ